jgi:diguanylate cyclase (GGDEF)-like protein/PAS domain S-box-containing protein
MNIPIPENNRHPHQGLRIRHYAWYFAVAWTLLSLTSAVLSLTHNQISNDLAIHGVIWLLGLGMTSFAARQLMRTAHAQQEAEDELRESAEKYRIMFRDSPDAYLIIMDGAFIDCNRATEIMLRGDRAQIIGQPPDILSPEFQPDGRKSSQLAEEKIREALQTGSTMFEWVHRRLDGSDFFVEVSIASMTLHGKPALFTTWRDITERKQAQHTLACSEMKYRTLYDSTSDAVLLLDERNFIDCNKAALEMFGYSSRDKLCSTHPGDVSPKLQPCGRDSKSLAKQHIATAQLNGSHRFEWVHRRADTGRNFHAEVLLSSMELDGMPVIQATVRDIGERKHAEKTQEELHRKLEVLSATDGLTGIANRRGFDETLAQEYARHTRSGAELSLIMVDIDYFKLFNDYYGHVAGDECLRQIGRVMAESAARPADLSARYGGEEFVCILPETDSEGAVVIAEKIRQNIQALAIPHKGSRVAECVTASLGVITASCEADGSTVALVSQVDDLLYRAKSNGRNRVESQAASGHQNMLHP